VRIWSASAICSYYLDPTIELVPAGNFDNGRPLARGYYIVPHWDPDYCQAFGGISMTNFGPFVSRLKARKWSRKNLVEPDAAKRADHFRKFFGIG
jgi:hypothetical protein